VCKYTGGCAAGWADCNTTAPDANGCETNLSTTANCGACGRACPAGSVCSSGSCVP
jgi:hypothetical protein